MSPPEQCFENLQIRLILHESGGFFVGLFLEGVYISSQY